MSHLALSTFVTVRIEARRAADAVVRHLRDDRGEGVISTALAVLIVAFLAVAAFFAFQRIVNSAGDNACQQVMRIGEGVEGGAGADGCQ